MKTFLALVLVALGQVGALAQITIPDKVDPYQPIVAGCNCIVPQGGEATFMWSWDKSSHAIPSDNTFKLYVWAAPGPHDVSVIVFVKTFRDVQVIVPDPMDPGNKDKWTLKTIKVIDNVDYQTYQKEYTVNGTPTPTPGPGPSPNPPPGPGPAPAPTDDFATQALSWLRAIPPANYKKELALAVADNYQAVASQAAATTGWDLAAFGNAVKQKNQATLGAGNVSVWGPTFFVPLAQYQKKLFDERKLEVTDTVGLVQIWKETSEAIKKAATTMSGGYKFNMNTLSPQSIVR